MARMTFGCRIWSLASPARLAAGAVRMSGPIGNRRKRMHDKGWRRLQQIQLLRADDILGHGRCPKFNIGTVRALLI
jgi:hypothetical protein